MSLLLEALKKAELAKQAAKEPPPAEEPPFTRDKLPDIRQPMEIRSEDLSVVESAPAAKRAEKPVLELALEEPAQRAVPAAEPAPAPQPPPQSAPSTRAASFETEYSPPSETQVRKQAQQLFEAKELDVNPRKPFYYTVGALILFGIGTAGYFWYEMQPKNNYKIPPPSARPAPQPVAAMPAAPAVPATSPDAPAAATVTPPVGSQPAVSTAGGAPAPAAAVPPAAPRATPSAVPGGPVFARAPAGAAAPAKPARRERDITITPSRVQIDPVLESAYQAYNGGDLARARDDYQQVLRANPASRDALLGLAAVETQARRYDAAETYYTRLLELDPRDAHAQAALIGLRGQADPLAAESRLKSMIAAQPEAGFLHFALGNQFAAQNRWAEAQQAYFHAYTSDPENADFAYNLAIGLDRIHQAKAALEYYRRALALADKRPVAFDRAQVSKRVSQLQR